MIVEINGIRVTWDDHKNEINKRKHGIGFETAAYVFLDEYRVEDVDLEHSGDELRYVSLGMVRKVLFVVYTQRGDTSRLISARVATPAERSAYYGQFGDS
ncbi:MAG: BrnT family toxin [Clostridia bacterium]|nr:BrnT family toxin [Clostridia bacterium]